MTRHAYRSADAIADIQELYLHLYNENPAIADSFLNAIDDVVDRLLEYPKLGVQIEYASLRLQGVRMMRTSEQFSRYLVFYLPVEDGIKIVRVLYSSRDIESVFSEE